MRSRESLIIAASKFGALVAVTSIHVHSILGPRGPGRGKVEVRQRSKTKQQIGIAL